MEQYARKRYFSTIAVGHIDNNTWDGDPQIRGVHPPPIPRDLLSDPQTWLHAKTLIVGHLEEPSADGFGDQEEAELDEVELQDVVAQFKRNTRLLCKVFEVRRSMFRE